jgi:hypothetical protein
VLEAVAIEKKGGTRSNWTDVQFSATDENPLD